MEEEEEEEEEVLPRQFKEALPSVVKNPGEIFMN